jgi:prenylcysteine oxidase / farnesylcysteine lyase
LQKYAQQDGLDVNITIFEKTNHIGGRTLTVNAYDDPSEPVELGASIFVKVNEIMYNATREFNLSAVESGPGETERLAIWDGEKVLVEIDDSHWSWWTNFKLWWRYGMAPRNAQQIVDRTISTFLKLYKYPFFPFRSLTTRAYELGLTKITGVTGEQFLTTNKVSLPLLQR